MNKCCSLKLDRCIHRDLKYEAWQISSTIVSIENYENQFFISDFTHIHVYVFRFSFLITLNISKDYFNGRLTWWNWMQRLLQAYCDRRQFALFHLSLEEAVAFVCSRVLWPRSFLIFIVWMNWRTLQSISFLSWCVSHVLGSMHRLVGHVLGAVHWKKRFSLHYKSNCVLE